MLGGVEEKTVQGKGAPDLRVKVGWVIYVDVDLPGKEGRGGVEGKQQLYLLAGVHLFPLSRLPRLCIL